MRKVGVGTLYDQRPSASVQSSAGVVCQLCNEIVDEGSRRDHVAKKHAGFSFRCPVVWCKSDGVAFSGDAQTALNKLYDHFVRKIQRHSLSL